MLALSLPRPWCLALTAVLGAAMLGCERESLGPQPELAKGGGGATPLTATPAALWLRVGPPTLPATVTAKVQYVGAITSASSDQSCATVSPKSLPATKPAGSSVYVATFTVTPVGAGTCAVTLTDKRGTKTTVQVRVRAQRIVFSSFRDGNWEIYDMLPDGSDPVRLTTNAALDASASVSRDGSRIAFVSERDGNQEIYVMNPDGSGQTRLTSNTADDYSPAISPDGTRIAFSSTRDEGGQIYSMAMDGSDVRRVPNHEKFGSQPSWSPDGTRIVFHGYTVGITPHISVAAVDGSSSVELTESLDGADYEPKWSPDGTKIAFMSNGESFPAENIYVMNADGSNITRLTPLDAIYSLNPAFSLDGSRIAFTSVRDHISDGTGNTEAGYEIYTMRASDGGDVVRLPNHAVGMEPTY